MHILYSLLLTAGFVLALPWFLWKGRSTGKYLRTFRERMGRLPVYLNVDGDRSIWIHAVSVGEVLAARPLVPALRERFPGHRVFLSTTTMTGNAVAKKSVIAPPVSAQKPPTGLSLVIFWPMVLTMRQPPNMVPRPIAR